MSPGADLEADRTLAERLRRTWGPFFGPHGRLRPIQRAVMPRVLSGEDVLVSAPTASGKTEAVCAPLVERLLEGAESWNVLYISPTRALVNDLHERLHPVLRKLNVGCGRRTSDYKDRIPYPRGFILTTPESTDSLLCRGLAVGGQGHVLASVQAVVLDEIHLLHGTARGDQLRWLLVRLTRLSRQAVREGWRKSAAFQRIGLSATLQDLAAVREAYLPNADIIEVEGTRDIEIVEVQTPSPSTEDTVHSLLSSASTIEKVLVFCNSRKRVDELSAYLKPIAAKAGSQVVAHHAGLGETVRKEAERSAKSLARLTIVATATLELGIDIGDIDLVVLDGPPPDIPALLQRIGRGNRRRGAARVIACAGSFAESLVNWAMIDAARAGWLGVDESGPSFGVAWQQVISYVYQSRQGYRSRANLLSLLHECEPRLDAEKVLAQMLDSGELLEERPGIRLSQSVIDRAEAGHIHSNIEGGGGFTVIDENGLVLAEGTRPPTSRTVHIGGRALQVKKWRDQVVEVLPLVDATTAINNWGYYGKAWMHGAGQPQAVRRYLGISERVWPVLASAAKRRVFHFGGARRQAVLWLLLRTVGRHVDTEELSDWYWSTSVAGDRLPAWVTGISEDAVLTELGRNLGAIERRLARPAINSRLPAQARFLELQLWLRIEEELALYREVELKPVTVSHTEIALRAIADAFRN